MSDYPDPEEEYELMYADDLELLREMDDDNDTNPVRKKTNPAKRSLDFSGPIAAKSSSLIPNNATDNNQNPNNSLSLSQSLQPLEDLLTQENTSNGGEDILTQINENLSNKRTAEDLFGDINDIDFDNLELPSKRQKTDEENDMDLINKILEGRKIRQMLAEPSKGYIDKKPNFDVKDNLTRNIPRSPKAAVASSNKFPGREYGYPATDRSPEPRLLSSREHREQLEAKNQQKESNELVQETTTNDSETTDSEMSDLWVERYRPKSYIDLLSEEPVNRALLHWLHLWDKAVFKKDVKTKEPQHRNTFSKRTGQFQLSNKWKGKKENEPEVDEDGRPHHKVALLCGPPGVGKTTLAHLLARLAVSLIVTVGSITSARLAARLSIVAKCEKLRINPRVLSALAARAQGDIRAALHVLSFLKARAKAQVNIEDVENASIGTKDNAKSIMQALQALFTVTDTDPNAILKTIQAAGEYDRLIDGIFENYLTVRSDSRLLIASETMSWLRLYDTINSWILRHQNYSLYSMLPICVARCHSILATRQPVKLRFPIQGQEMFRKKTELDSIVWSVWRGSTASVATTRSALRLDILPLLPYLLSPVLRSANIQLCSETERKSLATCAGAMCDYGLQYIQQRTPEGLYAFVLEPDVYKVAFFGNEDCVRPPPAVRQAIAREQQLEVIRRNDEMMSRMSSRSKSSQAATSKPKLDTKDTAAREVKEMRIPNHLQRLQPKAVQKITPQVQKDFFGRIVPVAQVQKQDAVSDVISSSSVFYQYREGFNNAVRRNVRMRDLF
ncbi:jg18076 [Pararge aegeria aegeria]|uniref:Jg18076 protein n=1 Tax=Pararge aegeria aegeria TaxID=348720 RepID=A0A8S4RSP3_9NEOP|nr:jg18076 [Pararge aegeria aegeria]